jgi:hypothetical protein
MDVTIVTEQGTHLLITCGGRFAVIERRNNRLYNCHDGKREGISLEDLSTVSKILDERDWTDQATAQMTFDEVVARGTQLAERML